MSKDNSIAIFSGAAALLAAGYFLTQTDKGKAAVTLVATGLKPTEFALQYFSFAKASQDRTGVPALVTLAQAGIESGWGKHAPGFNFFGIKPGKSWKGQTQKLKTWECGSTGDPRKDKITDEIIKIYAPGDPEGFAACVNNGKYAYRTYSIFRKYATPEESFTDHGQFLRNTKRYAAAFGRSPEEFAREIINAGYAASTPGYADLIAATVSKIREILKAAGKI